MAKFDPHNFRDALGQFATGVTIVTARAEDGHPVGVTANSFNSVSMDPPLVLWSLARSSRSMKVFEQADSFAVHILASDQDHLSNRFASRDVDKFAGIECGEQGPPLLHDCTARFLCKTRNRYDGGDHIIFVGEVVEYDHADKPPLLFHGGDYADKKKRAPIATTAIEPASEAVPDDGDPVLYSTASGIATITLNSPGTRNALADNVIAALIDALDRAENDPLINCVILTGNGPSFCSGGNIKDIKAMTEEQQMGPLEIETWYREGIQRIPLTMDAMSVPVIAAVNGHAIGAGCDLACMCDIRIGNENAVFAESFLRVGIIPGDGGAWLLPRIVGMARASQMLFTGEFVKGEKCIEYGLLSEVVANETLITRALQIAESVAGFPPQAIRKAKRLLKDGRDVTLKENLDQAALQQGILQQMDDHREAINAILEKRKPEFRGK